MQKIDTAEISDEEYDRFKTDLGAVMQFIKHQSDEDGSWIKGKTRFEGIVKVSFGNRIRQSVVLL